MKRVLDRLERIGCRPVVVVSHPRSGTHLCIDTLRLNFPACSTRKSWFERVDRLYLDLDLLACSRASQQADLLWDVLRRAPRPVIKTHAMPGFDARFWDDQPVRYDPGLLDWLRERATWLYIYRDGRPAICSWQNFLLQFDASAHVPISAFLRQQLNGISRVRAWADHVNSWQRERRVYSLSMDDLLTRGTRTLRGIAQHLELPWSGSSFMRPAKAEATFLTRLARRIIPCPQSTAISAHPQLGQPVDWRKTFTRADRAFFEAESGGLLVKLGYEPSSNWVHCGTAGASTPSPKPRRSELLHDSLSEVPAL